MDENRRGLYRIEYPAADRPRFIVDGVELEVVDCSESGLRYALTAEARATGEFPRPGTRMEGVVRFTTGSEVEVVATPVNVHGQEGLVGVRFLGDGVPFRVILAEQKDLRRRYRARFGQ